MSYSDTSSLLKDTFTNYNSKTVSQIKIVHIHHVINSSLVFSKYEDSQGNALLERKRIPITAKFAEQ